MRLYQVIIGLLPVEGVANFYVIAKNIDVVWLYGYNVAIHDHLYDIGDIDVKRVTDFSKIAGVKLIVIK